MMSARVRQSVLLAGMLLSGAQRLHAQSCVGLADLRSVSRSVSVTGSGIGGGRLMLGRFGVASKRTFAGLQAGYGGSQKITDADNLALGFDLGISVPLGASGVEVCPLLQSVYQRGPQQNGLRYNNASSSVGLSIGRAFKLTSSVSLVPFIQGGLHHEYFSYTGTSTVSYMRGGSHDGLGSEFGPGLGVRIRDVMTIRSAYLSRFGGYAPGEGQPHFFISASLGFRR